MADGRLALAEQVAQCPHMQLVRLGQVVQIRSRVSSANSLQSLTTSRIKGSGTGPSGLAVRPSLLCGVFVGLRSFTPDSSLRNAKRYRRTTRLRDRAGKVSTQSPTGQRGERRERCNAEKIAPNGPQIKIRNFLEPDNRDVWPCSGFNQATHGTPQNAATGCRRARRPPCFLPPIVARSVWNWEPSIKNGTRSRRKFSELTAVHKAQIRLN